MGAGQADRAVLAAAGGGEPAAEVHVLADLQAVGEQGGAGVVAQLAPSQSSWPPMWAPSRRTAPSSPEPVAVNPPRRYMLWPTCRPSAIRAGPESLRRVAPVQSSWPPMWAPGRRTAPSSPAPVAVNPPREEHALADLQAVSDQGGAGVVAQARPVAVEAAADVGADQADRAALAWPMIVALLRSSTLQVSRAASRGGSAGCSSWHPVRTDGSQAGIPGEDAFLQEAIVSARG